MFCKYVEYCTTVYDQTGNGKIQNGGRRCGNSHISACRRDSNEISTDTLIFYWSSNVLEKRTTKPEVEKSKMAAAPKRNYSISGSFAQ